MCSYSIQLYQSYGQRLSRHPSLQYCLPRGGAYTGFLVFTPPCPNTWNNSGGSTFLQRKSVSKAHVEYIFFFCLLYAIYPDTNTVLCQKAPQIQKVSTVWVCPWKVQPDDFPVLTNMSERNVHECFIENLEHGVCFIFGHQ